MKREPTAATVPPGATVQRDHGWSIVSDPSAVIVRFDPASTTELSFAEYAKTLEREMTHRSTRKRGMLLDIVGTGDADARRRRLVSDIVNRNRAAIRDSMIGCAIVMRSPIIRGIWTAITWVSPPPTPVQAVGSVREAITWLCMRDPTLNAGDLARLDETCCLAAHPTTKS